MTRLTWKYWGQGLACGALLLSSSPLLAALKPHALFSDNTVLQQGKKVPVWGTTDKTDKVTVTFEGQEVSATPENGKWKVELQPLKPGGPFQLNIAQGDEKLEVKNVLVGDVWIAGGQSNMEWPLTATAGAKEAIAESGNDKIRLFTVPRQGKPEPQSSVTGNWSVASPTTTPGFSAVAYYFGRDLQKTQSIPIGLISSNIGGTTSERWMSKESIEVDPVVKAMGKPQGASDLYNAMIFPLAPYAITGAIWYQGESNADRAWEYRTAFPAMIKSWRDTFGQGDFPFFLVQLAPFMDINPQPTDSNWAELRDAQLFTTNSVPNTAQAVIIDVGDEKDIHPQKKEPVGARLALAARALKYGEKIEYLGPVYDKLTISGDKAIVSFKHVGGGLLAKPLDGPLAERLKVNANDLTGFTIAGEDKKFYNATAKIEGDTVVVSSDKVAKPVAVRYGWSNYPVVNLWNKDNLPATPFRSDDFKVTTQK